MKQNHKTFPERHGQFLVAFGIFLFAYVPALVRMWERWFARDTYYSHGWLIPLVVVYLIWQQMPDLKKIKSAPAPGPGAALLLAGAAVYLLGARLRINFVMGFSMLAVLPGMILALYGRPVLRRVAFPLFFVVFMIPLPSALITDLSFSLKMLAAQIAADIINSMGIDAVRMGSEIHMPHAHVVVDDVCSGLRSLIALTALGCIFAYWMKGSVFKKAFVFAMTVPIAIITNVCRVVVLSVAAEIWGDHLASGFFHDLTGWMVFVLAFILLFATVKVLE